MTSSGRASDLKGNQDDGGFGRVAAGAAIASLPLAAGNLATTATAIGFNPAALRHPERLLRQGASAAVLWRWAMVLDLLGYYLLIVPAILALRSRLRPRRPGWRRSWVDLAAWCLLAYCLVGAIGAAILGAALPPLIHTYAAAAAAAQDRAALAAVAIGLVNAVDRGMWNLLEVLLAGVGWTAMGVVLWAEAEDRRLGQATVLLGAACLVDALGTAAALDAVAAVGLGVYLVVAPAWACWVGGRLLRARPAAQPTRRSPTSPGSPG